MFSVGVVAAFGFKVLRLWSQAFLLLWVLYSIKKYFNSPVCLYFEPVTSWQSIILNGQVLWMEICSFSVRREIFYISRTALAAAGDVCGARASKDTQLRGEVQDIEKQYLKTNSSLKFWKRYRPVDL